MSEEKSLISLCFFFQAEDGIRDRSPSRGLGDVYKRQEYIEYIRVTKAEDLLLFSDYDLTYISQETGFSDCSHMIKTFRKYKNITPKQYRLQNTKTLH